ncbi:MAG: tyrosine-protein phosphatase [Lachnospiraceae bacterium]|nr:tyrosine-protein phosphatase [Lachnospiraceae bacterium]
MDAEESGAEADPEQAALVESQTLGLSGVGNARQLGGYTAEDGRKIREGVLLRTAALGQASEEDVAKLTEDYHLATVIDLRSSRELEAAPDLTIPDVNNLHVPIMDEAKMREAMSQLSPEEREGLDLTSKLDQLKLAMKAGIISDHMYIDFLSGEQGKKGYTQFFQELLALPEGQSLLFHCTQGKDRTGCAAMLILSALGVDEDTIMKDYLLTNTFNSKLIEQERRMLTEQGYEGEELGLMMTAMDEVDPQYMINALDWLKEDYGSVKGYITEELGISEEQIEELKDKFLE